MIKNTELCSDVTVVIRSSGERTEALCKQLVLQQVPREHVIVIHERPFNKALLFGYEVGLDSGLPWTLCLDSDVILSATAIPRLLTLVRELGKESLGLQGRVLDKFFGGDRLAGYHLYRTCLLDKARSLIPISNQSMRPETYVKRQMVARGHDWHFTKDILGLHDYKQFYRDIYRKMIVQARKGMRYVPYLLSRALFLFADDLEYKMAAHGLCAGLSKSREGALVLDASAWIEEANSLLEECGIEEKALLGIDAQANYADEVLASYLPSKPYQELVSKYMQEMMQPTLGPALRMKDRLLELGILRVLPWAAGHMLQLAGSRLVHWSEEK